MTPLSPPASTRISHLSGSLLQTLGKWPEQVSRGNPESVGQATDHENGRVPRASLDPTHVSAMQAGTEGEFLLRPAFGISNASNVEADLQAQIHARLSKRLLRPIGLQTMSNIGCGRA